MSEDSNNYREVFALQSDHQWKVRTSTAAERIQKLQTLKSTCESRKEEIFAALYADLRKTRQNQEGEYMSVLHDIDATVANLEKWMKPTEVEVTVPFPNCKARIIKEPRGVVLLYGAWNFPFGLLFQPLVSIIAAGNTAICKPNEMSPATSTIIAKIIREAFDPKEVAVFEGGVDLANALLELPVDHIFFTGSPAVGKIVMAAAAKNLASVTLELGGKNPVIVDRSANIADAAGKVATFRSMNSGQICLCPENVYVHEDVKDEFIATVKAVNQSFNDEKGAYDPEKVGKIVNERNFNRVKGYIDDAVEKGATLECGGDSIPDQLAIHPTVLTGVPQDARIMSEEVFGPILSVFPYKDVVEVYSVLHKQPKPLALYVFSNNDEFVQDVLANTASGGVTVNNCLWHVAEANLPFGGVGQSGMGRYHGIYGFQELSHERSVLVMPDS